MRTLWKKKKNSIELKKFDESSTLFTFIAHTNVSRELQNEVYNSSRKSLCARVNTRAKETRSAWVQARLFVHTLHHSLVLLFAFGVPVSPIPSAGIEDPIVGGRQGSGKEARIPKGRKEK